MRLRDVFWILDTKNSRALITKWAEKAGKNADAIIEYVESTYKDTNEQIAVAYWVCNGEYHEPDIKKALYICKQKHLDPLKQNPKDLVNTYPDIAPKEKPINPDDVLKDKKDEGNGVVSYAATDDDMQMLRKIIDTHFGKDANPWCLLQANDKGELTEGAYHMWDYYNAYPKRIAFRNGKLLAFSAGTNEDVREWWDRYDRSFPFIPYEGKTWTGRDGNSYEIGKKGNVFRSDDLSTSRERLSHSYSNDIESSSAAASKTGKTISYGDYDYEIVKEEGDHYIAAREGLAGGKVIVTFNKDLEKDGPSKRYNSKGVLTEVMSYRNDQFDGVNEEYSGEGNLEMRVCYKAGKRNGPFEKYYDNGQLESKGTYKDEKKVGSYVEYSEAGKLTLKCTYDESGAMQGPYERQYSDGTWEKGTCKDGEMDGEVTNFYANGNPKSVFKYVNGEMDGSVRTFYENGQVKYEGQYKEGVMSGLWKAYDRNGNLTLEKDLG